MYACVYFKIAGYRSTQATNFLQKKSLRYHRRKKHGVNVYISQPIQMISQHYVTDGRTKQSIDIASLLLTWTTFNLVVFVRPKLLNKCNTIIALIYHKYFLHVCVIIIENKTLNVWEPNHNSVKLLQIRKREPHVVDKHASYDVEASLQATFSPCMAVSFCLMRTDFIIRHTDCGVSESYVQR